MCFFFKMYNTNNMTPKKAAALQTIYFLSVLNDDNDLVDSTEFPLDVAFQIVGKYPSWNVDIFQDGNRFQMCLIVLELAGNWHKLFQIIQQQNIKIFWKSATDFCPEVECDFSHQLIEVHQPIEEERDSSSEESETIDDNNRVIAFLETLIDNICWCDLIVEEDLIKMKNTYLVMDKKKEIAILEVENHDQLYNIDCIETLDFWADYFQDDLKYNFNELSLGQLLSLTAFDENAMDKLLYEIISERIDL